ncbi:MAG: hypothetical protein A2Z52_00055 [Candidatus Moranbacteria bacterium RBG_19FT_COMBO_42_6]|nr:MAG: hypothetical protein A2Z52_00055 [Candidatus Moranbacteria bacterium RBG_19FT_COMBO_42_6]
MDKLKTGKNFSKKPQGSVLAATLIILAAMLAIALSVSVVSIQERKASIGSTRSSLAYQEAESGIENVMQKLKDNQLGNVSAIATASQTPCGVVIAENYKVELKDSSGAVISSCDVPIRSIVKIKSIGYSGQNSRAIEVAVNCRGWCLVTDDAPWYGTNHLATAVFQGKIWVMGGPATSDIWSSADGVSWTQEITSSPIWGPRGDAIVLVHTDPADGVEKLWLMGGNSTTSTASYGDVWKSANGKDWQLVTNKAWPKQIGDPSSITDANGRVRRQFSGFVFQGKMWIMGGWGGSGTSNYYNDVWSSSDGSTWQKVSGGGNWQPYDGSRWAPRSNHETIVYDDGTGEKMWIMGGRSSVVANGSDLALKNDVWWSSDGSTWTKKNDVADWSVRRGITSVVLNNRIWVLGGEINMTDHTTSKEVWTADALVNNWTEQLPVPPWSPQSFSESGALIYDNKMWLISGSDYTPVVWKYQP